MNQQPDKLFRDKLEHFQKPISANAWSRIENNLERKKTSFLFLKVAAAVTIAAGLGWWIMINDYSAANRQAQIQKENVEQVKKSVNGQKPLPTTEDKLNTEIQTKATKQKFRKKIEIISPVPGMQEVQKELLQKKVETQSPDILTVAENAPGQETPELIEERQNDEVLVEEPSRISTSTLVLSAEEVNAKYLHKENLQEQATPDNKRPSTLQRLLSKVTDLKNNQDPIGELRQKKDEILALNFKTDKQRNQNR